MTRIIKRYPNRKLYDTDQSSYVTLDQIEQMVRDGEDLRIVDNTSGEDITKATLAHIIFEHEKTRQGGLPLSALRGIIQSGEEFITRLQSPVTQFRDEFRRKAEAIEEGSKAVRDFVDSTQRSIDEMQNRMDDRLRDAVDQITHIPEMKREMRELEGRLRGMEARMERLERDMHAHRPRQSATASDPQRHLP
jgi:polyhydroxyalkanoate synthesis repressor PhaR